MSEIDSLQWWVNAINIGTIITAAIAFGLLILDFVWDKYTKLVKAGTIITAFLALSLATLGFVWNKNLGEMKDKESAAIQKESEKKIQEAKQEVSKIQSQIATRTLSTEQQTKLVQFLKNSPVGTVDIWVTPGMTEAQDFASQISDVLKQAGWQTTLTYTLGEFTAKTKGLVLEVPNTKDPAANALAQGLSVVGLAPVGNSNPKAAKMVLFVGAKP